MRKFLKDQLLRRFLEIKGNIYPDLIRVFYTNLKFEENNLVSHVKGVDMEITHDVWTDVAGLKYASLRINKGNLGVVEDFNKWVSKDDDHGASSSAAAIDFDEEDQAADMDFHHEEQPETNFGVGTSAGNQGDEMSSMSSFKRYMVSRLDGFAENQMNLHDLCVSNFQSIDNRFNSMDTRFMTLDEQIEAVHDQIFELQYGKDD